MITNKEKDNNRNATYDSMRIVFCMFMVAIHCQPGDFRALPDSSFIKSFVLAILFLCNSVFFMISGHFNLSKNFDTKNSIIEFYKKRVYTFLIPFLLYSLLTEFVVCWDSGFDYTLKSFLVKFYQDFFSMGISTHYWFCYSMLGLLISTPFFSILFHKLDDSCIQLLVIIGFLWFIVKNHLVLQFNCNSQIMRLPL